MVVVIGYCPIDGLLRADSVLVVGIGNGICTICRTRQPASLPRHRVTAVGRRITDCIVTNRFPIVGRQLVCPSLIFGFVPIGNGIRSRTKRASVRNVGILGLIQHVATIIVGVRDRLVEEAVVLANKLIQRIVLVIEVRITLLNVGNVPVRIILVLVRGVAAVLICRDKPGRLIRSVSRYIGQRRDIVARKPDLSACQSAERVIIKA